MDELCPHNHRNRQEWQRRGVGTDSIPNMARVERKSEGSQRLAALAALRSNPIQHAKRRHKLPHNQNRHKWDIKCTGEQLPADLSEAIGANIGYKGRDAIIPGQRVTCCW